MSLEFMKTGMGIKKCEVKIMNRNRRRNWMVTFGVVVMFCGLAARASAKEPVTGILGALAEEVSLLEKQMMDKHEEKIQGLRFVTGTLAGRHVVLAQCGMGKVNAAITTTLMIDHFKPTEVIFTGIAGGINRQLRPGDLVIGSEVGQHDYGTINGQKLTREGTENPITGKKNPILFPADSRLVRLASEAGKHIRLDPVQSCKERRVPKITEGVIATGDVFVASEEKCEDLRCSLKADAVEMEGGSVGQVAYQMGVPFLIIRSLSDNANDVAETDVHVFMQTAAHNSAILVLQLVSMLPPTVTTTAPAAVHPRLQK
jgi:adenosylhomocysteine nucleosidase